MKCNDIQELFGIYFDLPPEDLRRQCVKEHITRCDSCREEFEIWEESADLIREAKIEPLDLVPEAVPISSQVMSRIYQDESWRLPVQSRIYSIPFKLRRNLTAVIAFCLALFMFSFLYTLADGNGMETRANASAHYGLRQTAVATADPAESLNVHRMVRPTLASAGVTIIEPVKIGPIKTVPDYFLSLSILGLISTLLIMNWFTRTRA